MHSASLTETDIRTKFITPALVRAVHVAENRPYSERLRHELYAKLQNETALVKALAEKMLEVAG